MLRHLGYKVQHGHAFVSVILSSLNCPFAESLLFPGASHALGQSHFSTIASAKGEALSDHLDPKTKACPGGYDVCFLSQNSGIFPLTLDRADYMMNISSAKNTKDYHWFYQEKASGRRHNRRNYTVDADRALNYPSRTNLPSS